MELLHESWGEKIREKPFPEVAFLAAIVEFSDDAIIGETVDGYILSWNKAAEEMYGYTANEVLGKHMSSVIPQEIQEEESAILKNIKKGKHINHYETVRLTKLGASIDVSLSVSPIRNAEGEIVGAAKITRQITDRKRLKGNLKFLSEASKILSSSLNYKTTLANVTKLAVPHIADWCTVELLNKKSDFESVAIAHKDPEKTIWAKKLREKYPIDINHTAGIPQVMRTGKSEIYSVITDDMLVTNARDEEQLKIMRKIGFTSAMIVPLIVSGKPLGAITFVTAESGKQYSDADLTMAEELANRASLAMENAKLYEASQKELEKRKQLEKQKNDLISMASHELKTPLTSLKVFAQVLDKKLAKNKDLDMKKFIEKINIQIDMLSGLINELLDVTRMQRGKLALYTQQFFVKELAEEVIETLQPLTQQKLILDWHTNLPVHADKERIRQVIINLVTNAIKYSPEGDKILVGSHKRGDYIEMYVQDFGMGIAKEEVKKIFGRFYQAAQHKTFPGLGLGLYISSEIIKIHGGKMWVKSEKGKGSTFYFTLPISKENTAS